MQAKFILSENSLFPQIINEQHAVWFISIPTFQKKHYLYKELPFVFMLSAILTSQLNANVEKIIICQMEISTLLL